MSYLFCPHRFQSFFHLLRAIIQPQPGRLMKNIYETKNAALTGLNRVLI